nr:alpha/beta fold hydrolase [Marivivens donghaensis]
MTPIITVPGIGGSGPDHWQSLWEAKHPGITRFAPSNWDEPDLTDWLAALDAAVAAAPTPPILVAHSLGCLLAARYCASHDRTIKGIFSVARPIPSAPSFRR